MASLRERVEAEFQQIDEALRELPPVERIHELSGLELAGTASFLSAFYHGVENILKQALLNKAVTLPVGATWHRDLLQAACTHAIISADTRDRLAPFMAFRHFFTHSYGFELDPQRLAPLLQEVAPLYTAFRTEVERFCATTAKLAPKKRK